MELNQENVKEKSELLDSIKFYPNEEIFEKEKEDGEFYISATKIGEEVYLKASDVGKILQNIEKSCYKTGKEEAGKAFGGLAYFIEYIAKQGR